MTLIGERLTSLRKSAGLSQADLAERTDGVVSGPDIARIETGRTRDPSVNKMSALAEALGVTMDAFFSSADFPDALRTYIDSGITEVSEAEVDFLRQSFWPPGYEPTPEAYHALLDALRKAQTH